jgi:hypothetical protein
MLEASIYLEDYASWIIPAIRYSILFILGSGVAFILITGKYRSIFFIMILLSGMLITGLILEKVLFDARYPVERTSLFYWPVLSLYLYHVLLHLTDRYRIKKAIYIPAILLLTAPVYINFLSGINTMYARSWKYDAHTKDVMELIGERSEHAESKMSVSNDWLFEPTINYYIRTWGLNLDPPDRSGVKPDSDFIYHLSDTIPVGFTILRSYQDIGSTVLINRALVRE